MDACAPNKEEDGSAKRARTELPDNLWLLHSGSPPPPPDGEAKVPYGDLGRPRFDFETNTSAAKMSVAKFCLGTLEKVLRTAIDTGASPEDADQLRQVHSWDEEFNPESHLWHYLKNATPEERDRVKEGARTVLEQFRAATKAKPGVIDGMLFAPILAAFAIENTYNGSQDTLLDAMNGFELYISATLVLSIKAEIPTLMEEEWEWWDEQGIRETLCLGYDGYLIPRTVIEVLAEHDPNPSDRKQWAGMLS